MRKRAEKASDRRCEKSGERKAAEREGESVREKERERERERRWKLIKIPSKLARQQVNKASGSSKTPPGRAG